MIAAVEISESIQQGVDDLIGFLPRLIGFLLIVLVGYLVAKALGKLVAVGLQKLGTDRALESGTTGPYVARLMPGTAPSAVIGRVVFWFVMLGALSIAIASLGVNALDDFLSQVFGYLPNVVAAILIFVIAGAVAAWLGRVVPRLLGDSPTAKLAATVLPVLVMAIAVFMILNQLRIATDIVTITYASLLGSVALGMALAFGLGGRDVAGRMLDDAYRRRQAERTDARPAPMSQPRSAGVHRPAQGSDRQ